jgi:alpha-beta hydrolase superfamily lysophospholipase
VVVLQTHPDSDVGLDWRFPYYTRARIAGLGLRHRYVKDDQNLMMEEVMLDMAAAIKYLKEERGFKRVVMLGHSGGGSTVCFYQSQAETPPPGRVKQTPAGDPPNLNEYDLPPVDGLILSASHWGRGWSVLHRLDPSVTDESDPLSVDPTLDMYNPANGFKLPPEPSKYSREFLDRYAAAQEARMSRWIARARQVIEQQKLSGELLADPSFSRRSTYDQIKIQRLALTEPILMLYRKEANPKYTDLSLDPSDRIVGSNRGARPDLQNYEGGFHPQPVKARAVLSSESTASNVYMLENIKRVSVPILVMCGTADLNEWPEEQTLTFDTAVSHDKQIVWIEGANHPYLPSGPKAGKRDQRDRAAAALREWIGKRF